MTKLEEGASCPLDDISLEIGVQGGVVVLKLGATVNRMELEPDQAVKIAKTLIMAASVARATPPEYMQ